MFFSVIVPIYKIEKYIRRCVDSVLAQTFSDFELILVDDGSPDACPEICEEYAKVDHRIKVIHKENGGLVSARQAGIKVSSGEYVFNLDGDDALTADALQSAYKIISSTGAEMVSFSYKTYVNGEIDETMHDLVPEGFYDKADIEKYIFPKLLSDKNMKHIFYFVWGKAIKRSLIYNHQLNIDNNISIGEDLSCIVPCFLQANSVYMSRKPVYLYTIRNDSLSTSFNTRQIAQIEYTMDGLRKLDTENFNDFDDQIARYSCFMCFAILAAAAENGHFEAIREIKKLILNSEHKEEISKAVFENITLKSRIGIFLMKRQKIRLTFYFLYICKKIKSIIKREEKKL